MPSNKKLNLSATLISDVLNLTLESPVPSIKGRFIDVRDVARAHIEAFETEEAQGRRFVLSNTHFDGQLVLDIIHKNFPELNNKLPKGHPGDYSVTVGRGSINDSNARSIFNIEYINFERTIIDSVKQIIDI